MTSLLPAPVHTLHSGSLSAAHPLRTVCLSAHARGSPSAGAAIALRNETQPQRIVITASSTMTHMLARHNPLLLPIRSSHRCARLRHPERVCPCRPCFPTPRTLLAQQTRPALRALFFGMLALPSIAQLAIFCYTGPLSYFLLITLPQYSPSRACPNPAHTLCLRTQLARCAQSSWKTGRGHGCVQGGVRGPVGACTDVARPSVRRAHGGEGLKALRCLHSRLVSAILTAVNHATICQDWR